MKIKKEHLLNSLEVARMGVAGSDHLEQLGHFIFGGEHLITFNNRILIYHPLKTDFICSVRSEVFYKQLQKFSSEELTIELKKTRLVIKGEKGKKETARLGAELKKDSEIFEIIDSIREEQSKTKYILVPDDFITAIGFCAHSASKNAADGTLCCVCIDGDELKSSDSYRATSYTMDKTMSESMVLLDARVANEIKRFNMTHFGTGNNWLHFKNKEGVLLSARQIFGDFPDISESFEFEGRKLKLPMPETLDMLDFVSVLVAGEQLPERTAMVNIEDGYIIAEVDTKVDLAEKGVKLADRYKDLQMGFRVNIDALKSVLEKTEIMIYNLEDQKGMFKSSMFKHVIRLAPPKEESEKVEETEVTQTDVYDDDIPF